MCYEVAFRREEEGHFVKVNLEIAIDNLISQRLIAIQISAPRGTFSKKEARGFWCWHWEVSCHLKLIFGLVLWILLEREDS